MHITISLKQEKRVCESEIWKDEIFKAIISLKRDTLPAENAQHYWDKASVAKINYENRVIFGWYKQN